MNKMYNYNLTTILDYEHAYNIYKLLHTIYISLIEF